MANGKVTQKDIALASGVSQQLVSLIIRSGDDPSVPVKPETRGKVLEAMRRLNYRPNRIARSLQGKRHGSLGILVQSMEHIQPPIFKALVREAKTNGMTILVENLPDSLNEGITILDEDCVDAVVLFQDMPEELVFRIDSVGIPSVWVNTNEHSRPGSIIYDERHGMELAVESMRKAGRSKIAAITNSASLDHYCFKERMSGLRGSMHAHGMPEPIYLDCNHQPPMHLSEKVVVGLEVFLSAHSDLDGIVLFGDLLAPALYEALRRVGRKVGGDISVLSFNNTDLARGVWPAMTSLAPDPKLMAEMIVRRALELFTQKPDGREPLRVPYIIIERGSTLVAN